MKMIPFKNGSGDDFLTWLEIIKLINNYFLFFQKILISNYYSNIREREDAILDDRDNSWMDEETNNNELNALHGDHENNNSSSSGESGDGSVDSEHGIPRINLETQNENYEPLDQYRGQQLNHTDSDPMREMRYRDINELTSSSQKNNSSTIQVVVKKNLALIICKLSMRMVIIFHLDL
jgi:hypothetical protein